MDSLIEDDDLTVEGYSLFDQRINKNLNLKKIQQSEDPETEWQEEIESFLKQTPKGQQLLTTIKSDREALHTIYKRSIQDKLTRASEDGIEFSEGPGQPTTQINIIPNLNEDTILITRTPTNLKTFTFIKNTREGPKQITGYRDNKGRFTKKPNGSKFKAL